MTADPPRIRSHLVCDFVRGLSTSQVELNNQGVGARYLRTSDLIEDISFSKFDDRHCAEPPADAVWKREGELALTIEGFVRPNGGSTIGVACWRGEGLLNNHAIVVLSTSDLVDGRFAQYAHATAEVAGYLQSSAVGAIALSAGRALHELTMPLLPKRMQREIADFLDAETARIDALIEKKQRMIHLVQTRTLERAAFMTRNAGVSMPLRRVVRSVETGRTPPTGEGHLFGTEDIPWYSPADFDDRLELGAAQRYLSTEAIRGGFVSLFPANSTLVVGIGATAGRVAHLSQEAAGNQQLTCLVGGAAVTPRFLSWQLWSRREELLGIAPRTTLPILSNEFLKSVLLRVPSLEEQAQTVAQLDSDAAAASELEGMLTRQIALLRERRQALITAAVTGQLDVTKAAA